MNPQETFGKIYRIVASHSGKVLDFAQVRDNRFRPPFQPGDQLVARGIRQLIQFSDHSGANQQFLLFPQDDGAYVIASRDSGSVYDIAFASSAEETPAIDFPYNGGANQSFVLKPDGDGTHVVQAKHSGLVLDVFGESRDDRTRVFQHHFKNQGNQKFTFEPVDSYPLMAPAATGDPGAPPSASSLTDNLPATTAPVVFGEAFLPYFVAGDTLSRQAAVQQTPYYRLTRHQFWTKVGQFNFSGPAQSREFEIKKGLTNEETRQVEETMGLSLGLSPGGGSSGGTKENQKSGPFQAGLTAGLKITTTTKTSDSTETTVKRVVEYKGGPEILYAEYVLVDRFTLSRADGVIVNKAFESPNPDVFRQVMFPPQAAASIVARTV